MHVRVLRLRERGQCRVGGWQEYLPPSEQGPSPRAEGSALCGWLKQSTAPLLRRAFFLLQAMLAVLRLDRSVLEAKRLGLATLWMQLFERNMVVSKPALLPTPLSFFQCRSWQGDSMLAARGSGRRRAAAHLSLEMDACPAHMCFADAPENCWMRSTCNSICTTSKAEATPYSIAGAPEASGRTVPVLQPALPLKRRHPPIPMQALQKLLGARYLYRNLAWRPPTTLTYRSVRHYDWLTEMRKLRRSRGREEVPGDEEE